ncbi:MAG: N-acetylmuramoyl-L-alanine amidase [Clostridiaceae bacterium]|jgi:N-acetylmuramoyl-L-alanine amidase|nr:N-acetylmuramoyl-L-alanine amidase [Clostridiaceae bacterium]
MKKILILTLFLSTIGCANAFEIVYPQKTTTTIAAPSTFFIGHTTNGETLKVNNSDIPTNEQGNFSYVVKLKDGENIFTFDNGTEKTTYTITKPLPQKITPLEITNTQALTEYDTPKYATIKEDNSPLRSTPVDFGINRLSHLQKGVNVILTGEYESFYRVKLTDTLYGWIDKKYITLNSDAPEPCDVFDYQKSENKEFDVYEFYLRHKVPYAIEENPFKITFYNLDNKTDIFTTRPELKSKLVGYSGNYEGDKFVLKIRKFPKLGTFRPLKHINIVIDPGHGGNESGAIGCSGTKEKDINLQIAKRLKKALRHRGATVFMTRGEDVDMSLTDRVKFANDNNATIFISVHANSLSDTQDPNKHSGTSAYYYYPESKPLAENILASVNKHAENANDGVHQESFAVVRNTNALSVLVETGYMINPDEITKLESSAFQKKIATGIAEGVVQFFKSTDKK